MELKEKKRKVKVRGVATIDPATNEFGFVPYSDAPSTQSAVKTCAGGGKRWVTTGSDPSKMISLKSKESSADQYADFVSQFNALTKDLKPKKPVSLPDSLRVVKEQGLECWLDEEKGEMSFMGIIDLSRSCGRPPKEKYKKIGKNIEKLFLFIFHYFFFGGLPQ